MIHYNIGFVLHFYIKALMFILLWCEIQYNHSVFLNMLNIALIHHIEYANMDAEAKV